MENNIKVYRTAQGLSQTALADLAGISRPNLSKLENSKYPPCVESMEKIAKALKVPVENIFFKPLVIHEHQFDKNGLLKENSSDTNTSTA